MLGGVEFPKRRKTEMRRLGCWSLASLLRWLGDVAHCHPSSSKPAEAGAAQLVGKVRREEMGGLEDVGKVVGGTTRMDFNFGLTFPSRDALGLPALAAAIEGICCPAPLPFPSSWPEESLPPSALLSSGVAADSNASLKVNFPLASPAWHDPDPLTQPRP
jgi:hypothetical protein